MKALIVYAHPRNESFNQAILDTVISTLASENHTVTVRDLYKMAFDPVLKPEETIHIVDGKFVRDLSTPYPDVAAEQKLLLENDLIIYLFPIWWNAMPAIMKGYIDRVCSYGFFYSFEENGFHPGLTDKNALMISTTGQPQMPEEDTGLMKAIKTTTSEWIFKGNNGIKLLDHWVYGKVPYLTKQELTSILDDIQKKIKAII